MDSETSIISNILLGTASVSNIALDSCAIVGPNLAHLLTLPMELKSFACSIMLDPHAGWSDPLNCNERTFENVFIALASQASMLKSLSITIMIAPFKGLDPLEEFAALETVTVDGRALEIQFAREGPGLPFAQIMPPKLRELRVRIGQYDPIQSGLARRLAETIIEIGRPTKLVFFGPQRGYYSNSDEPYVAKISGAVGDICRDLGRELNIHVRL
jgi:hypothetical protein